MLVGVEQYMSPPASSEALTPKYIHATALDSPMDELQPSMAALDDSMQVSPTMVTSSMQPPPVPTMPQLNMPMQQSDMSQGTTIASESDSPSHEEAARALELVMTFFQQQRNEFSVEPQEFVAIGQLMQKLKVRGMSESLPSGMRRGSEPNYGMVDKIESGDTLH
jgi:hypothetical protein